MTSTPVLKMSDEGFIRTLMLSNPAKKNALTREMLEALAAALPTDKAGPEQPIRVVVITGDPAGGAFSSGYDINAIDEKERARGLDPILIPANAIENCAVPVVAALNGHVFGGAFELAMACHIRICSPAAKLGMPPAKLGLVYSPTGLQRFLRATSASVCQRLFLTGAPVDASEAWRVGLVDVLQEDPLSEAKAMAEVISNNAPLAVAGLLDAVRRLARPSATPEDVAAVEASRAQTVASKDLQEGVAAFVERRAPNFRGE